MLLPLATFANSGSVVVTFETSAGEIDVEVDETHAPLSAADFLRYVDGGLYEGATFYRVVTEKNDHGSPKIQVIQGGLADDDNRALPPIAHETTKATGIRHLNGTISLARGEPGTGSGAAFFICIGAQPALDFGGMRNRDGLGFAAFGHVIRGMDVVRKIQSMPANETADSEYMRGQILAEPVIIKRAHRKR
jgi:peptidyl-prolyl cis-trans isomerase A (cyclophilin A)